MKNLYFNVHVIQSVPASNINRGESGEPKSVIFGGEQRTRVSSQSWKKVIRDTFKKQIQDPDFIESYRTKKLISLLAKELQKRDDSLTDEQAEDKAHNALLNFLAIDSAKPKESTNEKKNVDSENANENKPYETGALLFFTQKQIDVLADYCQKFDTDKKLSTKDKTKLINQLDSGNTLDLALFGRMVAEEPSLNVEAAASVAHAFSVNKMHLQNDFYTALDDFNKSGQGSSMLGTTGFTAPVLYRYANINVGQLINNLGGDKELALTGIKLFLDDFVKTMPNGMSHSFANKSYANYIMCDLRSDSAINLSEAFENIISNDGAGCVANSITSLEKTQNRANKIYPDDLYTAALDLTDGTSKYDHQADNLSQLVDMTSNAIEKEL